MPTSAKHQRAVDAETTPLRDPELYQFDLNLRDVAEVCLYFVVVGPAIPAIEIAFVLRENR